MKCPAFGDRSADLIKDEKSHEQEKTMKSKDSEYDSKNGNETAQEKTKPSKSDKHSQNHSH